MPTESGKASAWCAQGRGNVLLADGEFGPDAAGLADVKALRQAVLRADHVRAQAQAGVAPRRAVGVGGLGLQPVQQGQGQLFGRLAGAALLLRRDINDGGEPVVVLRPVDQRDVRSVVGEVGAVAQAAVVPQPLLAPDELIARHELFGIIGRAEQGERPGLQRCRVQVGPAQVRAGPERRLVGAPEVVLFGLVNGVVFAGMIATGQSSG